MFMHTATYYVNMYRYMYMAGFMYVMIGSNNNMITDAVVI